MNDRTVLQAGVTAVAIDGRAVLIEGPPGSGKSGLALALIDRGARLIGDDGITCEIHGDRIHLSPPQNIEGMLEIRGVGIVQMKTVKAPLALILSIETDASRLPETVQTKDILGHQIPFLKFQMDGFNQALRAEWALRTHGLTI